MPGGFVGWKSSFFSVLFVAAFLSGLAFADDASTGAKYLWSDGTSAPGECVAKCSTMGIFVVEKESGDMKYLSEACKTICLGASAATGSGGSGPAVSTTGSSASSQGGGSAAASTASSGGSATVNSASGSTSANKPTAASSGSSGGGSAAASQIAGNDRDEHGCIGSAGYTWCASKKECIRSWETECPQAASVCPQLTSPSPELEEKCKAEGKTLGKIEKEGCTVGYECRTPESSIAVAVQAQNAGAENACAVPSGLYSRLKELTAKLSDAEKIGDNQSYEDYKKQLGDAEQAISEATKKCGVTTATTSANAMPTATSEAYIKTPGAASAGTVTDSCQLAKASEEKIADYEKRLENASNDADRQQAEKIILQLKSEYGQLAAKCSAAGSGTQAAAVSAEGSIYGYYKAKVDGVVASSSDAAGKVEQLQAIRNEIDGLISKLLSENGRFNASEIAPMVKEIKVTPTSVSADEVKVDSTSTAIAVEASSGTVEVSQGAGVVTVSQGGVEATSSGVSIRDQKITVGNNEVKVLPVQAKALIRGNMDSLELREEAGKPVYEGKVTTEAKILGIIPTSFETTTVISADSGQVVSENKPWWSIIAIEKAPESAGNAN